MGGVKLKTKYNAPSDIKREKSKSNSPDSGEKNKKRRKIKIETGKVSQAKLKSVNKKITKSKTIKPLQQNVFESPSDSTKRRKDNILLSDCDTWGKVHCHDKQSHSTLNTRSSFNSSQRISRTGFRKSIRSSSAQKSILSTSERSTSKDKEFLRQHRAKSKKQRIICKNGPGCDNHDWDKRAPVKKVCTRDEMCPNHDWSRVDKKESPYKVIC
jgi:hypothetical protein